MLAAKAANLGPELMRFIEKSLLIQTLDAVWKEHLYALDHLRQGIGLRAYGQHDPLNEYKSEAFALFNAMLDELKERTTAMLCARPGHRRGHTRAGVRGAAAADDRTAPRAGTRLRGRRDGAERGRRPGGGLRRGGADGGPADAARGRRSP